MHDRRIDGEPQVFGNAGGLYMRAMTWYDHTTESIWSQPLGRAMTGPRQGAELALLPSVITSWSEWKHDHPGTLALITDTDRLSSFRQVFEDDFVVGIVLGDDARAYNFEDILGATGLNDQLGEFPILIWAKEDKFRAYLRRVGDQELTF